VVVVVVVAVGVVVVVTGSNGSGSSNSSSSGSGRRRILRIMREEEMIKYEGEKKRMQKKPKRLKVRGEEH
jgi:hypothetical protein